MPRGSGANSGRKRSEHDNDQHIFDRWLHLLITSIAWHFRRYLGLPQTHPHSSLSDGELIAWAFTTLEELGEPWEGDIPEWE